MTDDLMKRLDTLVEDLREGRRCWPHEYISAAVDAMERIEELEAKLAQALWVPMEAFAARTKAERETHCRAIRHGFKERRLLAAIFGERNK